MKTLALAAIAATFAISAVLPASAEEGRRHEGRNEGIHHRDNGRHEGWRHRDVKKVIIHSDRGRHEGWRHRDRDRHHGGKTVIIKHGHGKTVIKRQG